MLCIIFFLLKLIGVLQMRCSSAITIFISTKFYNYFIYFSAKQCYLVFFFIYLKFFNNFYLHMFQIYTHSHYLSGFWITQFVAFSCSTTVFSLSFPYYFHFFPVFGSRLCTTSPLFLQSLLSLISFLIIISSFINSESIVFL